MQTTSNVKNVIQWESRCRVLSSTTGGLEHHDEPGVREAALAMVEEETRRYRPTKNYLEHLPALDLTSFETDLMRTEFERLSNRQAMDTLSMKR